MSSLKTNIAGKGELWGLHEALWWIVDEERKWKNEMSVVGFFWLCDVLTLSKFVELKQILRDENSFVDVAICSRGMFPKTCWLRQTVNGMDKSTSWQNADPWVGHIVLISRLILFASMRKKKANLYPLTTVTNHSSRQSIFPRPTLIHREPSTRHSTDKAVVKTTEFFEENERIY